MMATATLQTIVRDPRTGKVHLPHEQVEIMNIMQNLDRTLLRVRWQGGGDCVVFPTDIEEQYAPSQSHGSLLH